jgi:hypothetical protein
MSAVVAIRNATQMLSVDERLQITDLILNLKTKFKELNSDAAKHDKVSKTELAKRNTLLKKIHDIEPDFTDEGQTYDNLKNVLDTVKSNRAHKIKQDKRQERLLKKWTDAGFDGDCPQMDNDTLDTHIKTLLKKQRDDKDKTKKEQALILSVQNKRKKIFDKVSELGLQPAQDTSLEQLQTILTRHNDDEKQRKKDDATVKKFRNQLDEIIAKNPDARIKDAPIDAGPTTLENTVNAARETRDTFKKEQKEHEKTLKAKERVDKKLADEKKKSDAKAEKIAAKDAGVKGIKKNPFYQAFTKYITQEIEDGQIDQSLVDDAGGKGKYNSKKWKEMDDSQKKDPTAPWNLISA